MIPGGSVDLEDGQGGVRLSNKTITMDVNFDGVQDQIRVYEEGKDCRKGCLEDSYSGWASLQFGGDTSVRYPVYCRSDLSNNHVVLYFTNVSAFYNDPRTSYRLGGPLFRFNDAVEARIGPNKDKARGRIDGFSFEFDRNFNWIRNTAEILTPYGRDIFDLSTLTLIEPVTELERRAEELAKSFRHTGEFKRREAILKYAPFHLLRRRFQEEVEKLETKLALAIDKKIKRVDLDERGKQVLLDKVGKELGLQRSATDLVSEARRKPENITPTSTAPSICPLTGEPH